MRFSTRIWLSLIVIFIGFKCHGQYAQPSEYLLNSFNLNNALALGYNGSVYSQRTEFYANNISAEYFLIFRNANLVYSMEANYAFGNTVGNNANKNIAHLLNQSSYKTGTWAFAVGISKSLGNNFWANGTFKHSLSGFDGADIRMSRVVLGAEKIFQNFPWLSFGVNAIYADGQSPFNQIDHFEDFQSSSFWYPEVYFNLFGHLGFKSLGLGFVQFHVTPKVVLITDELESIKNFDSKIMPGIEFGMVITTTWNN